MKLFLLVSATLITGVLFGLSLAKKVRNAETDPVSAIHTVDYFISDDSFSEVLNAKAVLDGLSTKFLTELRSTAWTQTQKNRGTGRAATNLISTPGLISALEHGIREFKGTEHELDLLPDLLRALKADGQHERWLQTYLQTLYDHPTHSVVMTFAREAIQISRRINRENDVIQGLAHVCSIPLDFPTKIRLQATLIEASPKTDVSDIRASSQHFLARHDTSSTNLSQFR